MRFPRSKVWHDRWASRIKTMVEKRPTWRVLKEEEHSRESVGTVTRNVGTRERIVHSESKAKEDPEEVVVTTKHARTAIRKDMKAKIAGSYIRRRCHNGSRIR